MFNKKISHTFCLKPHRQKYIPYSRYYKTLWNRSRTKRSKDARKNQALGLEDASKALKINIRAAYNSENTVYIFDDFEVLF